MSQPSAISAVTKALQSVIGWEPHSDTLSGIEVTAQHPSRARNGTASPNQINLFLYSTTIDTSFINTPGPGNIKPTESEIPPLSLILKYLISFYGEGDDEIKAHHLLGHTMSVLNDYPVLGRGELRDALSSSGIQDQLERVRITPDTLSLDDMSKLWTSFQSEYRLSAGYEVSVVLIESTRASRAPLPVLKRGEDNQGPDVVAAPSPSLSGLRFQNQKPGAELADPVTLLGEHLTSDDTTVRFQHPRLDDPIDIQPEANQSETEMEVILRETVNDLELGSKWPAGFYTLYLLILRPDTSAWKSNPVSMPLSPKIESISPTNAPAGNVVLTIECMPQITEGQRVALLFSDRTITPDTIATPADPKAQTTLTFTVANAVARDAPYVLRLRVDGVDSIPVDFSGDTPQFADSQKVTIT